MRTFKDIADTARSWEATQQPGTLNVMKMIYELGDAMDRLEHNLAFQLSRMNLRHLGMVDSQISEVLIASWLQNLRVELPEQ